MRPVKGWGALGGGGGAGGRSSKRSMKAPKSSLMARFSRRVIMTIPAKPRPSNTHRFVDDDMDAFPSSSKLSGQSKQAPSAVLGFQRALRERERGREGRASKRGDGEGVDNLKRMIVVGI